MLLATALALLITGCAQQTFTVQNKPAAVAPKETITHHFFVSGDWAEENCRCSQNLWQRNVVKTRNPANIRKWIARFYYFRHLYSAGSACVLLTIIAWVAHRYGQLYLHCSLIYFWVPFQLFLHGSQPLSEGEIIPFSGVCQSGEAALSTPGVVASRTDWQTALMCNRRRPAAASSRRASFSALASS